MAATLKDRTAVRLGARGHSLGGHNPFRPARRAIHCAKAYSGVFLGVAVARPCVGDRTSTFFAGFRCRDNSADFSPCTRLGSGNRIDCGARLFD